MNNIVNKVKEYGIKNAVKIFFQYKFEPIIESVFCNFFSLYQMKDAIIFSSHNDFDMNAGTLYNYLLQNNGNQKYKLIWFVGKVRNIDLPQNVIQISLYGINFKRYYWQAVAKYIFYDDTPIQKVRDNQIAVYLGHATRAMKNCRGKVMVPKNVNYVCSSSEDNDDLMSEVYVCEKSKMIHTGFPVTDLLYNMWNELDKLKLIYNYKKIIIWMPTFRQSNFNALRNDSEDKSETGLSLIETVMQFEELDQYLKKNAVLMLIKFHPVQDMKKINMHDTDNIILLSPEKIKLLEIDTYKLLTNTDALISDYSSISFDYLLLNRPIAYVLSDYDSYKLGFAVDNPEDYMPGEYLYNYKNLTTFIDHVLNDEDKMSSKRKSVCDKVALYNDGNASKRIVDFFHIL